MNPAAHLARLTALQALQARIALRFRGFGMVRAAALFERDAAALGWAIGCLSVRAVDPEEESAVAELHAYERSPAGRREADLVAMRDAEERAAR